MAGNLNEGPKKLLQNPACRYESCKMKITLHQFGFYKTSNDGIPGFNGSFLAHYQNWGSVAPKFSGKNSDNILNHQEDPLGIILSPNLAPQDHQCGFHNSSNGGIPGYNVSFSACYQKGGPLDFFFAKYFLETSSTIKRIIYRSF